LTGREGDVVLGKKSGKASVTYSLERLGMAALDDDTVNEVLGIVKKRGIEKRGLLTDDEFTEIVGAVVSQSKVASN
jgi:methanogen homocitrate synthase